MVELIYTDKNRRDVNPLIGYNLDLAIGADENNFELTLPLKETDLESGCYIYMEGTEYGGIIDKPGVNTRDRKIKYNGRTWHGILNTHILEPESGVDYLFFDGEANEVIAEVIELTGLGDLFEASTADSGLEIDNYECRYTPAYAALADMLFKATGKLHMEYREGKVRLSALPYIDYSQNEEWDASQKDFSAERNDRPVNHLVCLGSGNLKDRHVIHLFADAGGGVQPYTTTDIPTKDEDYILDKRGQQLFGADEVAQVYDYANAEATENYVMLTNQPADWMVNFGAYYMLDEDGTAYIHPEAEVSEVYSLLTVQPSDWNSNCERYYVLDSEGYYNVSREEENKYSLLTAQPSDWNKAYSGYYYKNGVNYYAVKGVTAENYKKVTDKIAKNGWKKKYGNYYTRMWDGTQYVYERVPGVTKYRYEVQTRQPSDWDENYTDYFRKKEKESGYEAIPQVEGEDKKAPKWVKKKYYTRYSYTKAPKFKKSETYFVLNRKTVAPTWKSDTYYSVTPIIKAPTWAANTYYYAHVVTYKPEWKEEIYYQLHVDHYAKLVEAGLKKMKEFYDCDKINIELNPTTEYDIGDVVGATEPVTGLSVWQPIVKKIVTINNHKKTVSYKVG